jgi:hypothetical protein
MNFYGDNENKEEIFKYVSQGLKRIEDRKPTRRRTD